VKKLVTALVFFAVAAGISQFRVGVQEGANEVNLSAADAPNYNSWHSGDQVRGRGAVVSILSDDNDGSRHQRFILELSSGRTVLIVHNIDLAPRVPSISTGDTVSFYGQYESNDRGGVIHWTHKDPQGRHVDGWLEHRGNRYQ
jgi:hypothetical protein